MLSSDSLNIVNYFRWPKDPQCNIQPTWQCLFLSARLRQSNGISSARSHACEVRVSCLHSFKVHICFPWSCGFQRGQSDYKGLNRESRLNGIYEVLRINYSYIEIFLLINGAFINVFNCSFYSMFYYQTCSIAHVVVWFKYFPKSIREIGLWLFKYTPGGRWKKKG